MSYPRSRYIKTSNVVKFRFVSKVPTPMKFRSAPFLGPLLYFSESISTMQGWKWQPIGVFLEVVQQLRTSILVWQKRKAGWMVG